MACFHCECKRPRDEFMETQMHERQQGHMNKFERVPGNREDISNAWNLNFDDDESDGADVAAFEYADSARMGGTSDVRPRISNPRDFRDDSSIPVAQTGVYIDRPGTGFDDFDDEDDVESYEVDAHDTVVKREFPTEVSDGDFSDLEDIKPVKSVRGDPFSRETLHKATKANARFSGSDDDHNHDFGSDDDLSVHPNWKSSHVANSNTKLCRYPNGPSRGLSFGSDKEFIPGSDSEDDFGGKRRKNERVGGKYKNRGRSDSEDEYGSESGGDDRSRGFIVGRRGKEPGRFVTARDTRNGFREKFRREPGDDFVPRDEYKFTRGSSSSKGFRGKPSGRGRGSNRGGEDSDSFDDFEDDDFRESSRGTNRGRRGVNNFRGSKDSDYFDDFKDDGFGGLSRSSRNTNRGRRGGKSSGNRGGGQRGGFDKEIYGRAKDRFSSACDFGDDDIGGRDRQRPRRGGGFGDGQRGKFNDKSDRDMNFSDDRPRRERIIER